MMAYGELVFAVFYLPAASQGDAAARDGDLPAPVCAISMRAPIGKVMAAALGTVTVIAAALEHSTRRWLSASAKV